MRDLTARRTPWLARVRVETSRPANQRAVKLVYVVGQSAARGSTREQFS